MAWKSQGIVPAPRDSATQNGHAIDPGRFSPVAWSVTSAECGCIANKHFEVTALQHQVRPEN